MSYSATERDVLVDRVPTHVQYGERPARSNVASIDVQTYLGLFG